MKILFEFGPEQKYPVIKLNYWIRNQTFSGHVSAYLYYCEFRDVWSKFSSFSSLNVLRNCVIFVAQKNNYIVVLYNREKRLIGNNGYLQVTLFFTQFNLKFQKYPKTPNIIFKSDLGFFNQLPSLKEKKNTLNSCFFLFKSLL